MALNLNKMFSVTPAKIRNYAKAGTVQVRRKGQPKKYAKLGDVYEVVYKVKCTKEWRNVTLRFLKAKPTDPMPTPSLTQPVWVRCTCPWFLYNCEYALTKAGSSWIHYSNGAAANQTNPKNIPYVCKHVYCLQPIIAKESKKKPDPVRDTKRKVLPESVLDKLRSKPEMEKLRDEKEREEEAGLTSQQKRMRDKTLKDLENTINLTKKNKENKKTTEDLKTVKSLIEFDNSPIADKARNEIDTLIKDVKVNPNDDKIVRKLNQLIKKFRGF